MPLLDIKRRIKSVNSTMQVTKAMNLVASSKLTRAKDNFNDIKPFFESTKNVIANVVRRVGTVNNPFLNEREIKRTAVVVITGDRGLCGGYNAAVCKCALNTLEEGEEPAVVTVGTKGRDFFKHRNIPILSSYREMSDRPSYTDAKSVGEKVAELFLKGEVDEVYLAYTKFISTISNTPEIIKLLPLDPDDFKTEADEGPETLTIYEPGEEEVLEYIVPRYINTVLYGAMVESSVCELSSRMTAMDAATDNAAEMIDTLNIQYNRARQGAITQEITEIVSGSNALE
ncbi:MAG: ATP synthase F1 subunit gamma [Firmicutes bacterium]|nr:ATP synthase F1 subunit gamma [Bacillota bacterium]